MTTVASRAPSSARVPVAARVPTVARAAAPARTQPTGIGWYAVAAGLALALAPRWLPQPMAVTLGLALLAMVAMAWWLAPRRLRAVQARWLVAGRPHAGEAVTLGAELELAGDAPPLVLEAWNPITRSHEKAARLRALPAGRARTHWEARFPKRGLLLLPPLTARCDQPFGLVSASRAVSEPCEVLVLPAIGGVRRAFRQRLRSWLEAHAPSADAGDDEIAHLRAYRPGDPPNRVHWRATARNGGKLLVTERHALGCRRLALVLDLDTRAGEGPVVERLISAAATIIDDLCARGWDLTLHTAASGAAGTMGDRDRLLEALALTNAAGATLAELLPPQRPALVLTPRPVDLSFLHPRPLVLHDAELPRLLSLPRRLRRPGRER